jgi:hypothetical protein
LRSAFDQLVAELCRLEGCEPSEPGSTSATAAFEFELYSQSFMLLHHAPGDPRVAVYCCFGAVPVALETSALYRLLEINLGLAESGGGVFGVDAETRQIVFRFDVNLRVAIAQSLLGALRRVAEQAGQWQATGFIDKSAAAHPAAFSQSLEFV